MSRKLIYNPYSMAVIAILLILLALVAGLLFVGVVGLAFRRVGLSPS